MKNQQPVQVPTKDGVQISFDLYTQPKQEAVLLICPGFFQSKETAIFRRLSQDLAQNQDVICMDFRGHGRSGGLYTFSAKEGMDLEAVLEWAQQRYSRISLLGFSMGAAIVLNTASQFPKSIESVIAVSGPSSFEEIEYKVWDPEMIKAGIRAWDPHMGCRPGSPFLKKERPSDAIRKLSPTPVLLIHGTSDLIVSHSHSQRLYEAASEPKQLEIIEGAGHAEEIYRQYPEKFLQLIQKGAGAQ